MSSIPTRRPARTDEVRAGAAARIAAERPDPDAASAPLDTASAPAGGEVPAARARAAAVHAGRAARHAASALTWWLKDLMGDHAYQAYLDHHRATHGDDIAPMTEREFWRRRMDDRDRNPGPRCC